MDQVIAAVSSLYVNSRFNLDFCSEQDILLPPRMRIKVSLSAPFNPSKVLLPVPQDIQTISQLKKHVRQSLSTVSACSTDWRELKLEVDGFELLGGSQLDVLEDGDVVT